MQYWLVDQSEHGVFLASLRAACKCPIWMAWSSASEFYAEQDPTADDISAALDTEYVWSVELILAPSLPSRLHPKDIETTGHLYGAVSINIPRPRPNSIIELTIGYKLPLPHERSTPYYEQLPQLYSRVKKSVGQLAKGRACFLGGQPAPSTFYTEGALARFEEGYEWATLPYLNAYRPCDATGSE